MASSLARMLQLLEDKTFQPIVDIKIARNTHVRYKAQVDFVLCVIFLLNEFARLDATHADQESFTAPPSVEPWCASSLIWQHACSRTSSYVRCMTPAAVML